MEEIRDILKTLPKGLSSEKLKIVEQKQESSKGSKKDSKSAKETVIIVQNNDYMPETFA